jgi:hypothetical protein
MNYSTQRVEGPYVHSNLQQYTEGGEFLCAERFATVHRQWRVLMCIVMYNSTQRVKGFYVHSNTQ